MRISDQTFLLDLLLVEVAKKQPLSVHFYKLFKEKKIVKRVMKKKNYFLIPSNKGVFLSLSLLLTDEPFSIRY